MRLQKLFFSIWWFFVLAVILSAAPGYAAGAIVRDGDTIQLGSVTYRLDGIDAPELDQICIDDHADPWTCGVDAREQLTRLIGGRSVHCDDLGVGQVPQEPAHRRLQRGWRYGEPEPATRASGLCRELRARGKGSLQGRRGRARKTRARASGKAASSPRRNSASARRTAPCSALRAGPTATAKSAPCCSPTIWRCRRVAASKESLPCAHASPAISESTICRVAPAIRP